MICPYYKNRDVFDGFNEIIVALGGRPMIEEEFRSPELRDQRSGRDYSAMEAAYRIYNRNGGNLLDRTPQDKPSVLFQTLLDHFNGDRRKAIIAKSNVYSNEFFNWFGDWTGNTNSEQFDEETKKQISLIFKRIPKLSEIGTEEQYAKYIQTIFPLSKDKSIYWHGSNSDFSEGFKSAKRGDGSGAPETKKRNDFYLAKLAWSVLQYVNGVNRKSVDKNGFSHWNKLWWEFKEIMSNGRRLNNDWKDLVINEENVRQAIPNKKGIFNRDKGGNNGKWLKERKADYGYENKSDKEFFEEILGVKWGKDTFNTWTKRNEEVFKSLQETEKGIYPAVINTQNPIREFGQNTYYEEDRGLFTQADANNNDAILSSNADNEFNSDIAVVLRDNKRVHFLGTEDDIESFEEFVTNQLVSKAVDLNGEPLVVWHGSHEDFSEFDVRKTRYFPYMVEDYKGEITGVNDIYSAFFFSSNKQYSERYSGGTVDVDLSDEEYELRFSALNEREKMLRKRRVTLRKLFNSAYGDPLTKNGFSGFEENIPLEILDEFDKWVKEGDSEEVKDKIKKYNKIDAELEARINNLNKEKYKRTIRKPALSVLYPVYLNIKRDITNEVSKLPFVFAYQSSSRDFFNESYKTSSTNFIEIDSMLAATARYFLPEKTFRDNVGLIGRDRGTVYMDVEEDNMYEAHTGFEYAVFDPNQIKHVENLGTWSTKDSNIYHLMIGEKGAKYLDSDEQRSLRIDNLMIANQMEKAGKSALTIKTATGWERGVDGKWRYEIPDVKLKKDSYGDYKIRDVVGNDINHFVTRDLSEVIDLNSLPPGYREELEMVGKIRVYDDPMEPLKGSYSIEDGEVIFMLNLGADESPLSILAHEFLHFILEREGFQQGGNPTISIDALLKQRGIYEVYKKLLENQDGYERTLMRILSKDDKYVEYENISRDLDRVLDMIDIESSSEEEVDDFIKGYIPEWLKGVSYYNLMNLRKEELIKQHQDELNKAKEEDERVYKEIQNILNTLPSSYEAYLRLAGEAEARAVGRRTGLSELLRKNSLLTDDIYKDVSKDDLIFLQDEQDIQQDDILQFEQTNFADSFGQELAAKLLNGETVSSRELMGAMIANRIFSIGDTKLAELLSLHDVPVRVANSMGVGELAETITDNGGSVILINPNEVYNISRGYFGTAMMHEIIHAVTVDIIDNPRTKEEKEFVKQNRNTYERINSYFRQNGAIKLDVLGGMHVLDNEKEFAAYFASDPTVRAAIVEMAESLDRTHKGGLLKRIVRLINKFIPAFIKRAIGVKQTAVEQVKLYEKTLTDFLYNRPLIERGNIPSKSYLKAVYAKENGAITNHENFIDSMKLLERMNKAQKNFVKLGTERYNITIGGNNKRVQITSWDEVKLALSTRVSALQASNMDSVVKSRLLSITLNLLEMFVIDEAGKYLAIQNLLDTAIPLIIEDIDNLKKIRRTNGKFTNDDAMYHMHANLGMYHEVFDTIKKMISDDHNRQEMVDLFNASVKEEKDKISIEDINEIERHLDNATAYTKEGMSVVEYMIKENVINKLSDIGNQVGNPEMGDYLNALNSEMSSDLIDDIGMFESWAAPADASTNEAVRTIAYLINKAMNIATMSTAGKATDLLRLKENLKKGEHEWDIYERDENGNFTGYLVRDLNFGRFYRDYQNEIRDINSKIRDIFNIPDLDLDHRIAPEINKTAIIDGVETTPKLYFERRKEKWLSTHAERRYTPEYYKLYAELPQSVKDSLSEIRVLINSITLNYKNLYDEKGHPHYEQLSDDDWVKINVLWERRRQLRSDYDEYGNKKHGRDLEDARALQKLYDTLYKKNSDGTNKQKVHDKTGWLDARNEIIRKYGKDSLELEKWDERNTRKVLKKNSYGETIVFKKIAEEFGSTPPSYGEEYEQLSEERREYLNNYRLANGEVDVNAMPEVIKNAVRKLDIKLASIRKSKREDEDFRKYVANYNEVKDKYIKYVYTKEFEKIYKQIEEEAERRAAAEDSDDFDAPSANEFMYAMLSGVYGEYVLYSDDIVDEDDFGEFRAYSWLTKIEARDELYMDLEPNDSWLDKEDTNNINKNFDESYDVPWVPKRSIYDNSEQYNKIFGVNGSDTLAALYTGVQETLLESNQMYNRQYADNFLLPLRECSFLGRLRRKPFWNGIMHYIAKTFGFFLGGLNPLQSFIQEENPSTVSAGRIIGREEDPNDTEIGQNYQETINGDYQHVGGVYPDGRDFHIIPQYFTKRMKHPEYISRNVVDITASYYKMAQMYHLRSIIRNDCEAILDVLRDLKFRAPDATALTKLIRKIGGSKGQESNTYQFAKRLIERDLYDVLRLPAQFTIAGKTYDISKILGLWKRWTTARNLGLNPKVAIVGFLTTSFTHILNGAVGYKYGGREMWNANKIVLKEFGRSIFSEGTFIGSRLTKSRVMLLMEMMDLSNQSDRKTEHSNRNRWLLAIYKNSTFGLLSAADVSSKSVIMVSTMLAYRYVDGEFMTNALIRESKEAFIQLPAKNKKYSNRYEELKALFKESDVTSYDIFIDGDEKLHVDPLYQEAWDKVKNTIMNRSIKNAELADGMATRLLKAMMTRSFLGAFALIHRQYIPLMLNQTFGKRVYDFDTEEYKNAQFRTMWAYMQRLMATNALAALGGGCFCGVALGGFGLVPLITGSLALAASLAKKYLGSERKSFKKSLRDEEFFNASGSAKARANSLANRYLVKQTILEVLLINCVIAPFANFMSAAADGWDKEDKLTRLILQWIAYFARAFQFESNAKYNWLDLNNNIQTLTAGTAVTEGSVDFLSALGTALANTGANILATGLYGSNTARSTARDIYEAYDAYQQSEDDEVIQRSKVYKGWTRLERALFKLLSVHNVVEQVINPEDKRRYQENKVMRMSKRDKRSFFYDLFVDDEKDITIFDIIHYI